MTVSRLGPICYGVEGRAQGRNLFYLTGSISILGGKPVFSIRISREVLLKIRRGRLYAVE